MKFSWRAIFISIIIPQISCNVNKEYLVERGRNIIYGAVTRSDGCPCAGSHRFLTSSSRGFSLFMRCIFCISCGLIFALYRYPSTNETLSNFRLQEDDFICMLSASSMRRKISEKVFKILKWNSILNVMIDREYFQVHCSRDHGPSRIKPDERRGFR